MGAHMSTGSSPLTTLDGEADEFLVFVIELRENPAVAERRSFMLRRGWRLDRET